MSKVLKTQAKSGRPPRPESSDRRPDRKDRPRAPRRLALGAALALVSVGAAEAAGPALRPLDPETCRQIRRYDDRVDKPSLRTQFAQMVLSAELCGADGESPPNLQPQRQPEQQGDSRAWAPEALSHDCPLPRLRRWEDGISFSMPPLPSWEIPENRVAVTAAGRASDATLGFLFETLGMDPKTDFQLMGENPARFPALIVALGEPDELRQAAAAMDRARPASRVSQAVDHGLKQRPRCFASPGFAEDDPDRPTISMIFIDIDLDPAEVADCVKEEVINSFIPNDPQGDASLFDDEWGRYDFGADLSVPGTPFSPRDAAILRMLYLPELHAGMPREEALAALDAALARDCGIGE